MKPCKIYFGVLSLFCFMSLLMSCRQELDLDDETRLKLEKQEKLEKLEALYDMAFENPTKADADFKTFVKEELLTGTVNFLVNNEINNSYSFTKLAIQLNTEHSATVKEYDYRDVFQRYKAMFETELRIKTLLSSIPEQLKQGDRLEKFEKKIAEIKAFHQEKIDESQKNTSVDESITEKMWECYSTAYNSDYSVLFPIQFKFRLNKDNSWDFENFFFMPAIPQAGGFMTIQAETDFDKGMLLSPLTYFVYENRICFYFHIKNTYNYESRSGKLERYWCYEYKYEKVNESLLLTEPKILFYMYPTIFSEAFDSPVYKENYLKHYTGFENGFTLNVAE